MPNIQKKKQRQVAQAIVSKLGKSTSLSRSGRVPISISSEMKKAGYSESYCKNPQQLMRSKSFKEMLSEHLSSELVAKIQKESLNAKSAFVVRLDAKTTLEEVKNIAEKIQGEFLMFSSPLFGSKYAYFAIPNFSVRDKALDKLYRLYGAYTPNKLEINSRPYQHLSDCELEQMISGAKKKFDKS